MQVRKKMWCPTSSLMELNLDNKIKEVMIGESCSVGYVIRSILRRIVGIIRVVGLIYIVHMKCR